MPHYLFSICIPVYNTEQYVRRVLDSIVQQTFDTGKIETVIVNDGSPRAEECAAIVAEYSTRLAIQYIPKEKNEGPYLARKTGVLYASGNYILFLDSDDTLEPYALQVLSYQLAGEPDYVQFGVYNVIGNEKSIYHTVLMDESHKTMADVLQERALHNVFNKCYHARFLKNIYTKLPNTYMVYAEDYYQSSIMEYLARKKVFLTIPLYNYFRNIGITSKSTFKNKGKVIRILESFRAVEQNLVSFFEEKGEEAYVQQVKDCIRGLYMNFAYWSPSLGILIFVIKHVPCEYRAIRLPLLLSFFLQKVKSIIKNILPYGLVRFIHDKRHRT